MMSSDHIGGGIRQNGHLSYPEGTSNDETIRVLHVDDDPAFLGLTSDYLERKNDHIEWRTEPSPNLAIPRLHEASIDCVVSDFEMPGMNGLALLSAVREDHPELPFILFTGKGSEEIASEAIQAGVTEYVQKTSDTEQYAVLANRVRNAVGQYRAQMQLKRTRERFRQLVEHSTDVISIVDPHGKWQFLTPSAERVLGYPPEELIGEVGFDYVHPEDREDAMMTFARAVEDPEMIPDLEFRFEQPNGEWIWTHNYARNMLDEPLINGFIVHTREITERKEHAFELERQNARLDEFAGMVSHDLRNPLATTKGYLELLEETCDSEYIPVMARNLDRMDRIIERSLTLVRGGKTVTESDTIALSDVVSATENILETAQVDINVQSDTRFRANREQTEILIENLIQNAIDHGGSSVMISVGSLEDGFFIEDDGPGLGDDHEIVFESGYSTHSDGVGFGLTICRHVAEAHGWDIAAMAAETGGARFEITGVELV